MQNSARAQSLALLKSGEQQFVPSMPESVPESAEAMSFLETLKPSHYASLAQVIELLMTETLDKRHQRPPDGLLPSPYRRWASSEWSLLNMDTLYTMNQGILAVQDSDEFKRAEPFTRLIGTLDPDRHIHLPTQLLAGVNTATNTMLTLLENVPQLVDHLSPTDTVVEPAKIARASFGLPWRMAMLCIEKMSAAQEGVSVSASRGSWAYDKVLLDPAHFNYQQYCDGRAALQFKPIEDIEVPASYTLFPGRQEPFGSIRQVSEIACRQSVTIGCPITLLHGRMREMWDWMIDATEQRDLWQAS